MQHRGYSIRLFGPFRLALDLAPLFVYAGGKSFGVYFGPPL